LSEYFIIHNIDKNQILNAESIGLPMNLEAVIGDISANLLAYLLTTKTTNEERFIYTNNDLKGNWKGDKIQIVGDQTDTEEFLNQLSHAKDITEDVYKEYRQANIQKTQVHLHDIRTKQNEDSN